MPLLAYFYKIHLSECFLQNEKSKFKTQHMSLQIRKNVNFSLYILVMKLNTFLVTNSRLRRSHLPRLVSHLYLEVLLTFSVSEMSKKTFHGFTGPLKSGVSFIHLGHVFHKSWYIEGKVDAICSVDPL